MNCGVRARTLLCSSWLSAWRCNLTIFCCASFSSGWVSASCNAASTSTSTAGRASCDATASELRSTADFSGLFRAPVCRCFSSFRKRSSSPCSQSGSLSRGAWSSAEPSGSTCLTRCPAEQRSWAMASRGSCRQSPARPRKAVGLRLPCHASSMSTCLPCWLRRCASVPYADSLPTTICLKKMPRALHDIFRLRTEKRSGIPTSSCR
mmetsp:Transcript_131522/g.408880  ORF Transcript_131522/g.408880 Transcript_131522/m.408880 type:complete len:207 (-) Transcript_131522:8-628(-)